MKKIIIFTALLVCVNLFGQQNSYKEAFVPDISVNKTLFLFNRESIIKSIGDQSGKIIRDENPSRVQLKNKDSSQYLIMYQCNGSSSNSFNEFEIGYLYLNKKSFNATKFECFFSHDKIRLGIERKTLIEIKGPGYKEKYENGYDVIEYNIEGNNSFLQYYNMPIYLSDYYFKKGKLVKFRFGFPNW